LHLVPLAAAVTTAILSLYNALVVGFRISLRALCYVVIVLALWMVHGPISNLVYYSLPAQSEVYRIAIILMPAVIIEDAARVLFVSSKSSGSPYEKSMSFGSVITIIELLSQYGSFIFLTPQHNERALQIYNYVFSVESISAALAAPLKLAVQISLTYTFYVLWKDRKFGLVLLLGALHYTVDVLINASNLLIPGLWMVSSVIAYAVLVATSVRLAKFNKIGPLTLICAFPRVSSSSKADQRNLR